jgi:hypothetical protein
MSDVMNPDGTHKIIAGYSHAAGLQERDRLIAEQAAEIARLRGLLTRYRKEVPVGNQPHMICLEVDKALEGGYE